MKMYSFYIINVFNDLLQKKLLVMLELLHSKILNCQIKIQGITFFEQLYILLQSN